MVGFMFFDFGGLAILDQRSFLNNRVGTKLFGDNINICDDVVHPLQSGAPFDGEGVWRHRVSLVENGVVKRLVYARATAEKMRSSEYKDKVGIIEPTGHGFPIPNEMGEAPMNIVFAAPKDSKTIDQMVASTEHGVLVTRLWYIREVDPYEKILTGMTRDGTFYVQDSNLRSRAKPVPSATVFSAPSTDSPARTPRTVGWHSFSVRESVASQIRTSASSPQTRAPPSSAPSTCSGSSPAPLRQHHPCSGSADGCSPGPAARTPGSLRSVRDKPDRPTPAFPRRAIDRAAPPNRLRWPPSPPPCG